MSKTVAQWLGIDNEDSDGRCRVCRKTARLGTVRCTGTVDGSRETWHERVCSAECAATYASDDE